MSGFTIDGVAVSGLESLKDPDGEPITASGVEKLEESVRRRLERGGALNKGLPSLAQLSTDTRQAVRVRASPSDHVGLLNPDGTLELVFVDDAVSYEPLSPLQLVEYCYEGAGGGEGEWIVSCIGQDCLDSYASSKYSLWKDMFLKAFDGCAKAFLPEIKRGYALTNVYDHMIFPYDPSEHAAWEVDHNGKIVKLPRPIFGLRVWNNAAAAYESISPVMKGAPSSEERDDAWQALLDELRLALNPKYGEAFIDDCLALSAEEVKAKYF